MSAGPSLYRRHRPRTFSEVVGQTHVVRTLRNAVERDKVHHAYLFVGSRGTGKTSMAKILAACLNCEQGPTTEPCGRCDSCVSIAAATSLDVIEMDAASNNSVDDIRELRDKVAYAPVSGRNKVYILDEAHMLSSAAWNAFLKTLEEPPPHTIFVLATTEANRVLPTVVDRCHRFDFTRPTVEQIGGVLRRVADEESIAIPDQALALVARHATGSFRDALGTLEQLVTYGGAEGEITVEEVLAVLGVADAEALFGTLDAVAAHDARAVLHAIARLVDAGRDAGQLVRELEAHVRELLAVQVLGEVPAELRLTPERDDRLAAQAADLGRTDVVRLLDLLSEALEALANGANARIQLELALVKAAAPEVDPSTRALLARIDRLERALAARPAPQPSAQAATPPPASAPQPSAPAPATPAAAAPQPSAPAPAKPAAAAPQPSAPAADDGPSADDWAALRGEASSAPASPPAASAPPPAPAPPTPPSPVASGLPGPATVAAAVATAPPAAPPQPAPPAAQQPASQPAPPAATEPAPPAAPDPAPASAPPLGQLDDAGLRELWPAIVDAVRADNAMLASVLRDARPIGVADGEALLAYPTSAAFFKRKAESDECRRLVARALQDLGGVALKPRYELRDPEPQEAAAEPGVAAGAPALTGEELVARFVAEFDAEELIDDDEEGGA